MTDTDILKKYEDIEIGTDKQRDILRKRKRETETKTEICEHKSTYREKDKVTTASHFCVCLQMRNHKLEWTDFYTNNLLIDLAISKKICSLKIKGTVLRT